MNSIIQLKFLQCLTLICFVTITNYVSAQQQALQLDLQTTVQLASDSSLAAFQSKNSYIASYWEYRTFKADRLPSLSVYMTPISYNRDYTRRYDSEFNIDVYRRQQSLYSFGNIALQQNFGLTGGTFFIDSQLGYFRNFGDQSYNQYTSVPVRIGYRQSLFGYNALKWEYKIAPLKYKKAQKQLLYELEQAAETATGYFFNFAMARAEYFLAKENLVSSDTIYKISEEKYKIASIGKTDLLTLKLDLINARNNLQSAEINFKKSRFALATYLNLDKNILIDLKLPGYPKDSKIVVADALLYAKENNPQYLNGKQQILQSEQTLRRTKIESQFNVGISASIGFNQVAESFQQAYQAPLQQDLVSFSLSIPIIDWGIRKGKYDMAKNNVLITKLTEQANEVQLEQDVAMTVENIKIQQQLIYIGEEAIELARLAYEQTRERFIIGKADINSLTLTATRRQETQRKYILALGNYWQNYYRIRKLTLYDFDKRLPIADTLDWKIIIDK